MEGDEEFLRTVDIFSLLSDGEIGLLASRLRTREAGAGETVFREGEMGDELFIVRSGKAAAYVRLPNGKRREIAEFLPGDFFGEMSIFENASRSATCYAAQSSRLLRLRGKDLEELVETGPGLAIKLMIRMLEITAKRLREKSEFLADMVLWGEKARRRAITDELTGVYNRRFLDEAVREYLERARNQGKPLALLMADLDYFRLINERFGHPAGDRLLAGMAGLLRGCLRKTDLLARYGGDEFAVIMPDTRLEEALEIAEQICRQAAGRQVEGNGGSALQGVTISLGVADYRGGEEDLSPLWGRADRALYRAKCEGRNRVVVADR